MSVTITSLTKNISKDYNYDIVILCDNLKNKYKKLLLEQVKPFENISLRFVNMNNFFKKYKKFNFFIVEPFTKSIYSKFFIPEIFSKYERVIWLDADILIYTDFIELYNIDIGDNIIAAVVDMAVNDWPPFRKEIRDFCLYLKNYSILNDCSKYVNVGVILYNIEAALEENFTSLCLEALNKYNLGKLPEQDIINIICKNKIHWL